MLPAARAGAHFHVESMNGAFQGVMTTVGPAGMRSTVLRGAVGGPATRFVVASQLGVGPEVARAPTDHSQLQALLEHRHVEALDVGDALRRRASMRSARRSR